MVCVVSGVRDRADLRVLLGFFDAPDVEKDCSVLNGLAPEKVAGRCVYCNHCASCPASINVGLVNKFYDLALSGDVLAADHPRVLRGLPLGWSWASRTASSVTSEKSAPLGKNRPSSPLAFSFAPRCQGAAGSQK